MRPVVFIDEADAVLGHRGIVHYMDTIVATFLSEMDGFDESNPLVILSTNYEKSLDEAIVRPGRMDIKIHVPRPTRKGFLKQLVHYGVPETLCKDCLEMVDKPLSGALANTIAKVARRKSNGKGIELKHLQKAISLC